MSGKDENTSGEIWVVKFDEQSAYEFREQVLEVAKRDPNIVIPIYIDSYGGFVDSLAKMLATMDEVPNRFVTICVGKAMSCGAILLSHGDLRFCDKYSRVMVHNVSSGSWGDAYAMKSDSDEALRLNRRFMGLLAENCGINYAKLQTLIKDAVGSKEIWLSAEEAQKFGIVDHVGIPRIEARVQWSFQIPPSKPRTKRAKGTKRKNNKSR